MMTKNRISSFKGGLVTGITFLTFGLVFLLDNLGLIDLALAWPIIPIGIGLSLIIHHYLQGKKRGQPLDK